MFLHPENLGDSDIRNLIHIGRNQFFEFVAALKPHLENIQINCGHKKQNKRKRNRYTSKKSDNKKLSIFSLAFLFRLKLAKNKSFNELGTLFVISRSKARKIYRSLLDIVYKHHVALPDIMKGATEVEKLFEDLAETIDPFYRELFKPFNNPKGKIWVFYLSKND